MPVLLEVLLLLALALGASAQDNRPTDPNNYFIYPPKAGPQYSGDPVVFKDDINITVSPQTRSFQWVSDMESMSVSMHQEGDASKYAERSVLVGDCSNSTSALWDGNLGDNIDLSIGNQMFLAVWNCSAAQGSFPAFLSHYFNLVEADSSGASQPSSSSSSSSSSASMVSSTTSIFATSMSTQDSTSTSNIATSAMSTSSSQQATPTQSPVPSGNEDSSHDSSVNSSAIGGGIGGGVGGAILIVGIVFALLKYWKRRRPVHELDEGTPTSWPKEPPPDYQFQPAANNGFTGSITEMETTSRLPELPAGYLVPEMPATSVTRTGT